MKVKYKVDHNSKTNIFIYFLMKKWAKKNPKLEMDFY